MRSQETLEQAVVRELAEETLFPTNEFLNAHKKNIVGLRQVKTYSEPKRDSWNFDKDVKPGEHRRTISTSFLATVPNFLFTRNLAYKHYYLKNNKLLHVDMDAVLPFSGIDVGNELSYKFGEDYDTDKLAAQAWAIVDRQKEPNKFLKENMSLNIENVSNSGPIFIPEKGPVGERKISVGNSYLGDAKEAAFFPVKEVLEGKIEKGRLAFDHDQILKDALNQFTESLAFSPIALDLCDEEFTISDVRGVYQAFWDLTYGVSEIDLGNFQNKMLKLADIEGKNVFIPTKKKRQMDRYKYNAKGEIIKVKGGPALLYKKNKNLKNFNLAIVPPKKR